MMDIVEFLQWKYALLNRHGLPAPDGRDLYKYRVTDREFCELEETLRRGVTPFRMKFSLVPKLGGFPALFVLYCAEWWRRRYDGSGFAWDPILFDMCGHPGNWTPTERSNCVTEGLQEWGLTTRQDGGMRFLGSVAVQGGLPLRLLAEARGKISQVLSRVLYQARGMNVTQSHIVTWVESLETLLPISYRQPAIFVLLADVAWTTLNLCQEAGLTSSANAILTLDRALPGWRDRFPLPIEDRSAQGLIEQLIRDAANVRVVKQTVLLPLERFIELTEDDNWVLKSSMALPDTIPSDKLSQLFGVASKDELPRTGEMSLTAGDDRQVTSIRRMAGQEIYRIERRPWGFTGDSATREHILRLTSPDGRMWVVTAKKGEALDEELPWVFAVEEVGCSFVRQGGGGVSTLEALVAVPEGWKLAASTESNAVAAGDLLVPGRSVIRIQGTAFVENETGLTCKIRTGQVNATDETYEWDGNRYWLDFVSPSIAFRGVPNVCRVGGDGTRLKADGKPSWDLVETSLYGQPVGPATGRYPASGEVKCRSRMLLLPGNASLKVRPRNARCGVIRLEGWGAAHARPTGDDIQYESQRDGLHLDVALSVESGQRIPEKVELMVTWLHTTNTVRVRVPFPSKGVRGIDGAGREMANGAQLAVQQVFGVRLVALNGSNPAHFALDISAKRGRLSRTYELRSLLGSVTLEVRLLDYISDINHLLSSDDLPDAAVYVVLRIDGDEGFKLSISRYAFTLNLSESAVALSPDAMRRIPQEDIAALPVLAARLQCPGDEASLLQLLEKEEGGAKICWDFSPETREPGSWLIFPAANASIPFRPTLWTVGDEPESFSPFTRAIGIRDQALRESALDEVISNISIDFNNPAWVQIEQLVSLTGHLPLSTLDTWRRFAHSASGMAALALRMCSISFSFVDRFSQELPFAWETVPYSAWKAAIAALSLQMKSLFGEEHADRFVSTYLSERTKELSSLHGALAYTLRIASAPLIPDFASKLPALAFLGGLAAKRLFEGPDCLMMTLRRVHADDDWPADFEQMVAEARNAQNSNRYLSPPNVAYQDGESVINLPLLLGYNAARNQTQDWFRDSMKVHRLRTHRAFDPDWFDEAYNQTITRCLADKLMDT